MRCYCCNKMLSDYESTRRSVTTGEFLDMCNACYATIQHSVPTIERKDLLTESDVEEMENNGIS